MPCLLLPVQYSCVCEQDTRWRPACDRQASCRQCRLQDQGYYDMKGEGGRISNKLSKEGLTAFMLGAGVGVRHALADLGVAPHAVVVHQLQGQLLVVRVMHLSMNTRAPVGVMKSLLMSKRARVCTLCSAEPDEPICERFCLHPAAVSGRAPSRQSCSAGKADIARLSSVFSQGCFRRN